VSLYRYGERMNGYVLLTLYSVHVYLALELILAAASRAGADPGGLQRVISPLNYCSNYCIIASNHH
jgi:hypothetical protein